MVGGLGFSGDYRGLGSIPQSGGYAPNRGARMSKLTATPWSVVKRKGGFEIHAQFQSGHDTFWTPLVTIAEDLKGVDSEALARAVATAYRASIDGSQEKENRMLREQLTAAYRLLIEICRHAEERMHVRGNRDPYDEFREILLIDERHKDAARDRDIQRTLDEAAEYENQCNIANQERQDIELHLHQMDIYEHGR
jgi:hypothetical protein